MSELDVGLVVFVFVSFFFRLLYLSVIGLGILLGVIILGLWWEYFGYFSLFLLGLVYRGI